MRKILLHATAMGLVLAAIASVKASAQTAAGTPSASGSSLQEVVVTASRRASTVQKTPITINVISATDISRSGVATLENVLENVPAVNLQQNNKGYDVNIRGVGTSLDSASGDPGINTNLDGVYLRQSTEITSALFDIARIEVLKGPQGTLYGRNATGGVVNVLTNDPVDHYEVSGLVSFGNYDTLHTVGVFNAPLTDHLAMRAAFSADRHDGYLSTGQDDEDNIAGRLKFLWTPLPAVRVMVGGSFSHDGGDGPGSVFATSPSNSRTGEVYNGHEPPGSLNNPVTNLFGQFDWDLGPARLTFIPTLSHYDYKYLGSSFGFYSQQIQNEVQKTEELRLASPLNSPVNWVVGYYGYQDHLYNFVDLIDSGILNYEPRLDTLSNAAFADATVPVTSAFRISAGIRYTNDHKTQAGTVETAGPTVAGPFSGVLNSSAVNYRAVAEYDVTPSSLVYANISSGYKSGGFLPDEPGFNTFKPEKLTALEIGTKNRFLNNRLQVDLSAFGYEYSDYQVSDLGFAHYGGLSALVFNAQGATRIYGAEAQVTYLLTPDDEFRVSAAPLASKFGTFTIPAVTLPNGPTLSPAVDDTGKTLPDAPTLSGNASYQHTWHLAAGDVRGRVSTYYSTTYWAEFSHAPYSLQPGYVKLDLDLTYLPDSGRWTAGAYVNNATNRRIVTQLANTTPPTYGLEPPLTYGAVLTFKY